MRTHRNLSLLLAFVFALSLVTTARAAVSDEHYKKAEQSIKKGVEYLRKAQGKDGSWSPEVGPAITGIILNGLLDQPNIGPDDPTAKKAIDYILSTQKEDGGFYDKILGNYNTAICVSALSRVKGRKDVAEALAKAEKYLRGLQWDEEKTDPEGKKVDAKHPYRGGFGYGKHGRPDGSNTQFTVQAFHDLGIDCKDPVFQEAVVFVSRLQGIKSNDLHGDKIQHDGGSIYATSINKDLIGVPESKANPKEMDEALKGKPVSNLRTYGSMTYAMFKTYVYAQLDRDDPRVKAALSWIKKNYTVDHNPGMPKDINMQGHFYYLLAMSRALNAWNAEVTDGKDKPIKWQNDVIAKLAEMQHEDGSWTNKHESRWMEGNPHLATGYALIALNNAVGRGT